MSLNYQLDKIKDYETVCYRKVEGEGRCMKVRTQELIHLTMALGMGKITEDNWRGFAARLRFYEDLFGPYNGEDKIDVETVRQHIGLWTNVPFEKLRPWMKRMSEQKMNELDGWVDKEAAKL